MHRAIWLLIISSSLITCSDQTPIQKTWQITDLGESTQALVVSAMSDTSTTATLLRYEKNEAGWQLIGDSTEVVIGRNGLAWGIGTHPPQEGSQKKEGDGKSPAGIFPLTVIFGTTPSDSIHFSMPYLHLSEVVECIDDVNSKFYNQLVNNTFVEKDWKSSEHMISVGQPYKWGILVKHNAANQSGAGSCIFLHVWKGKGVPTSGCTAMSEKNLVEILHWLDDTKHPVLVQGVMPELTFIQ